MIEKIIPLFGKSIQSQEVRSFLEEYQMKYPKKDVISSRAYDRDYALVNNKQGFELVFSVEVLNPKYTVGKGERKGIFVPIFTQITFNEKSKEELPFGINLKLNFNQIKELLGEPTLKSSEVNPIWLKEDGSESFYRWIIPFDKEKDVVLVIECRGTGDMSIWYVTFVIETQVPIIYFYNESRGSTIEDFIKSKNEFYHKRNLFFLKWALDNNFVKLDKEMEVGVEKVKNGEIEAIDFIKDYFKKGYMSKEDFTQGQDFIEKYLENTNEYDIFYERDFAYTFLKNEKLKDNFLEKKAVTEINKVDFTPENHKIVEAFIDKRYNEYYEHGFPKIKKEIS